MEGESARMALDDLKALGVTLVVDDFGTGYSSLIYLRRFPVDVLKVDKSFVAGLGESAEDTAIVTGVIRLAHALGLRTVAEGVETAAQLEQLAMLGCLMGQGYYWSRPLPAAAFAAWLDNFQAVVRRPPKGRRTTYRPLKVLIVDDQRAVRDLVKLALSLDGSFEVVGEAADGLQAIELAKSERPDLVVLDLHMPVLGGADALPRILEASPESRVVVLSALEEGAVPAEDLQGAAGYFDKASGLDAMLAELPLLVARPLTR
jgi:CheY-like chemotaxis protein